MPKSYEPCYTKTNKSGGKYTTCEGSQKKRKAKAKLKKGGEKPPLVKKKGNSNPQGFGNKFIFGQSPAVRKAQGRINTGTLNPANPNLSVNPWGTTSEIQAQTYQVNTDLFLQVSQVMTQNAKTKGKLLTREMVDTLPDRIVRRLSVRAMTDEDFSGGSFNQNAYYKPTSARIDEMRDFLKSQIRQTGTPSPAMASVPYFYDNEILPNEDLNPDIARWGDFISLGAKANKSYNDIATFKNSPPFYIDYNLGTHDSIEPLDTRNGDDYEQMAFISDMSKLKKTKIGWSTTIKNLYNTSSSFDERTG